MDVKNKAKIFRGLKLISYLTGLPLVIFYIWRDTQGMTKNGLKIAIIIWAAITVCQVVCSFLFKKNTYRRPRIAAITLAVALILTIVTPYAIDIAYGAKLDAINKKYADAAVTHYTYEELLVDYKSIAGRSESISGRFSSVYNLNAGNKGSNIIHVTVNSEGEKVNCDAVYSEGQFGGANYNPNGLLGDGYVFSSAVAISLLKQYHAAYDALLEKYGTDEKVQEEYIKALRKAKNSTEYKNYIKEDDVKLYIAEADKYNLVSETSSEKLDAILGLLGKHVGGELKEELGSAMSSLLGIVVPVVNGLLDLDATLAEVYGFEDDVDKTAAQKFKEDHDYATYTLNLNDMIPALIDIIFDDLFNEDLALNNIENQLYDIIEDLYADFFVTVQRGIKHYKGTTDPVPETIEISSVYELLNQANSILASLGLNVDIEVALGVTVTTDTELSEVLATVLVDKLGMSLQNDPATYTMNGLVAELLGEFVGLYPYQHPMVKPAFMFIDDEDMMIYAWTLYEGQVHGKFCGSVLIGDTIGDGTPGDQAFTVADIDRMLTIDAYEAEMRQLYSMIALRVMLINYAALIIGTLILVNVFGYFEDKNMAKLVEGEYEEEVA